MRVIKRLWRGEYSLAVAFWGFYFIGFVALIIMSAPFFLVSYRLDIEILPAVWVVRVAYAILSSVGVWRSARKNIASAIWLDRVWGYSARLVVCLVVARVIWINVAPLLGWADWDDAAF